MKLFEMSDEQQNQVPLTLRDLAYCWTNWSLRNFVEEFYIPCFKTYEWEKTYYKAKKEKRIDKYIKLVDKDDYLGEKWLKFRSNPVQYIGTMDNITLQYFAVAIHNSYTNQFEKS